MLNRTKNIFLVLACLLALISLGCQSSTKKAPAAPKLKKLVATYVQAPLNVPSIVEKNKQLLKSAYEKEGTSFSYSPLTSGADQTAALASGDIQILNCVGGSSLLLAAASDAQLKILSVYSTAPKAFMLYAKDGTLSSPSALKGKTIAGPKGTILHELLAAYLQKGGLSMKDVKFVSMGLPQAQAALEGGSVDCALLAGPLAYAAQKSGKHLVTNGEGLVSGLTLIATSKDFYQKNPEACASFLAVHKEVLSYIAKNAEEVQALTAKETGLSKEAVAAMYPLYDFTPEITQETKKQLVATQDFLFESKMLKKKVDINSLF